MARAVTVPLSLISGVERLRGDFHQLLDHEWNRGATRFVAAEQSFGQPDPVELALGSGSLFVRGRIDRLEVADGHAVVRDLNTAVETFPGNLVAGMFGVAKRDYFELGNEAERSAPRVSFGS